MSVEELGFSLSYRIFSAVRVAPYSPPAAGGSMENANLENTMKILTIADIDDFRWKHGTGQADVLISCGDVSPRQSYMSVAGFRPWSEMLEF